MHPGIWLIILIPVLLFLTGIGMIKKLRRACWIGCGATLAAFASLCFLDFTFQVHDSFRHPGALTYRSYRVVRYGISWVRQRSNADYIDGTGSNVNDGRCYIDIVRNGQVERVHGWQIATRYSPDKARFWLELK